MITNSAVHNCPVMTKSVRYYDAADFGGLGGCS